MFTNKTERVRNVLCPSESHMVNETQQAQWYNLECLTALFSKYAAKHLLTPEYYLGLILEFSNVFGLIQLSASLQHHCGLKLPSVYKQVHKRIPKQSLT